MSSYTPIASQTLSASASSVTFSGIPQTYTDLIVVIAGTVTAGGSVGIQYNGDTATNYSWIYFNGNGSAASAGRVGSSSLFGLGEFRTYQSNIIAQIQNYSNSNTYKSTMARANTASDYVQTSVGTWRSNAAITSLTLTNVTFASGTTFNLYGIAAGSPKAFGGDIVTTDGTYYYHTFLSSGTFTPSVALSNVDYLVVAGGGGGGRAGGGGGGGLRCTVGATGGGGSLESKLSLSAQSYTVIVGAGGAGSNADGASGASGNNSSMAGSGITTITSSGGSGGGGGGSSNPNILQGGSGGGGSFGTPASSNTGGLGTANQGYAGGNGITAGGGGGGGGAGAVGSNAVNGGTPEGGNGGNGVATSISGSSVTYAGGGGGASHNTGYLGGSGGTGGGGKGCDVGSANGTAGTANTGGGGGGSHAGTPSPAGKNGGSGIVIIRYSAV